MAYKNKTDRKRKQLQKKKKWKKFLTGGIGIAVSLLLTGFRWSVNAAETGVPAFAPGVTAKMYEPEYWQQRMGNGDEVLLDTDEITALNRAILEDPAGLVNRIEDQKEFFSGTERKLRWACRIFPEVPLYRNGIQMTASDFGAYLTDILGVKTAEKQKLRYGICVERADIKVWPELETVSKSPKDNYYDEFQISAAAVNTPVLIDGETTDRSFFHVVLYDCEGWAEAGKFAVCQDREEWLKAQEREKFLLVTDPQLRVGETGRLLTMGTCLGLADGSTEVPGSRSTWGCYVAELPCRRADGSYGTEPERIPVQEGIHVGFLPYTRNNVIEQSMSFLGAPYGWGSMYDSVDCSGLVQEVFACFGIWMPRNSQAQMQVPWEKTEFEAGMSQKERFVRMDRLNPGALLYFPGHIMLYLGRQQGEYYVISAVGSAMLPEGEQGILPIRSVIINTLSMRRKNGIAWEQEITAAADGTDLP